MKKLMVGAAMVAPMAVFAQTDITGVISTVTTYKDAAIVVGIALLLFALGRKAVRKLI